MSYETRDFTQCFICGINSNNFKITQHSKHCKVLHQVRETNDVNHDPESAEMNDRLNDRSSFSDSASYSSSDDSNADNRSEGKECEERDMNMFTDEQNISVEDYINQLTDESRQEIMYNPAVVLRYIAWQQVC